MPVPASNDAQLTYHYPRYVKSLATSFFAQSFDAART